MTALVLYCSGSVAFFVGSLITIGNVRGWWVIP